MADPVVTKRQWYIRRKGSLDLEYASFQSHHTELSKYYLPRNGRFTTSDRNKGDKRWNLIYDNAATNANGVLAAGLMSGMTSPARPWFRLGIADKNLMENSAVKNWLDDVTQLMRDIFAKSNTYRALHGLYEELALFGTGCDLVLDDFDDVIRHYPMTCGEYRLAINARQEVDTMLRSFEMTVSQIVDEYVRPTTVGSKKKSGSPDWSNVSTQVKNLWDQGKGLDSWIPVMHIIEPRRDRNLSMRDAKNMAFASCTLELNSSEDKMLRESGFKTFPVLAPRWFALGGDVYATRCPGMVALGDVKALQHGQLRKSQGIDYMVKPPIQVPPGVKSYEVDMLPGGVSVMNMGAGNGGAKTLFDVRLDLQWQLEDIKDIRQRIKDVHYTDLFMAILLSDKNQPETARAIAEKHEEKLIMLGPVLERLHNELLKRKIDITFDRMVEADILPPPPKELNGVELNVEFISMLAQAQRAIGTQSIDRFVQSLGVIAQFKPGVLDKFNEDTWADKYADMLGVDPDLIVANDKVAIVRQQRAEAQAKQQQLANSEQMAATAKTASEADTSGKNALTDVMQQFQGYSTPGQQ